MLFVVGATARWAGDRITANALMPGAIATNLQRYTGGGLTTPIELQKTGLPADPSSRGLETRGHKTVGTPLEKRLPALRRGR